MSDTHFGFQQVNEDEKEHLVWKVFKSVADKYDLMNDLMSGSLHRFWKDHFISKARLFPGIKILDVAGGTGDITKKLHDKAQKEGIPFNITVSDINEAMLQQGKIKLANLGVIENINWALANGESLPFEDHSFNLYTVAFGIRNMTHLDKVLSEAYRVLENGGQFLCLEFSPEINPYMQKIYDFYSFNCIPKIGKLITGDEDSYQYLVESIRKFPNNEHFKEMIEAAGFKHVTCESLNLGVVSIHQAWKN